MLRSLPICLLLIVGVSVSSPPLFAAESSGYAEQVEPFFKTYCLRCHDANKQEGKFRLDNLSRDFLDQSVAERWSEIIFRINSGEMPPKKEPLPKPAEMGRAIDWMSTNIKAGEAARMAKRGPVAHYRLSREEYGHTVYDLLGVHFDVFAPGAFNEDPRWHGFERVGSMLTLSPSHIDRYFKAAEVVLDRAFPEQQPKSAIHRTDAINLRHHNDRKKLEELKIAEKVRAAVWPGGSVPGLRGHYFNEMKSSGLYRVKMQLSGLRGMDGRTPHLSVWHTGLKQSIFDEDIIAPEDKPMTLEFETFLSLPMELDFRNEVAGAFNETGNHTLNVLNGGGNIFTNSRDVTRLNPTGYKLFDDHGQAIYPMLIIDSVTWEGPLTSEADLRKREGVIPSKPEDLAEARECLQRFATRAWRRPVTSAEVDRYVKVVESELAAGEKFPNAYRSALTGIITSKNFYYLEEGSATERRTRVNDWELASRLSYFLWNSMPDAELFALAQAGTLHEPAVLKTQLARILADAKSQRFTRSFPRQWLQLYKIGMFPPDPQLYPDYDKWLEQCMRMEPVAFFGEMLEKNLPLREFIASDWALVNPRLAQHYQLPPLEKSGFQRVPLKPEDHRGGLLTQAGVLMLTSDGTRHRPVHRGVWVSEAIFGRTPPPPPPNVEPLAPTPNDKPKATIRMQLDAHATHATCASCHQKIDPLGFAFENYDAIGQWRTEERVQGGQGANPPVNASGSLPDGRNFQNADEFKRLLTADADRFAEAFVEQLATYALRRVMTIDDEAQIKAITQASRSDEYRLKTVLENFVLSDLFQKR